MSDKKTSLNFPVFNDHATESYLKNNIPSHRHPYRNLTSNIMSVRLHTTRLKLNKTPKFRYPQKNIVREKKFRPCLLNWSYEKNISFEHYVTFALNLVFTAIIQQFLETATSYYGAAFKKYTTFYSLINKFLQFITRLKKLFHWQFTFFSLKACFASK